MKKAKSPFCRALIAGIVLIALVPSCKKSDVKASAGTQHDTTIYMAGYYNNLPVYTKNDSVVSLSTGSYAYGYALDICASGSDVYVGGYVYDGNYSYACYWKNGQLTVLGANNLSSQVSSIAVSGSNFYAVGNQTDTLGNTHSVLWKNGTMSIVDTTKGWCTASSILISGSDVYIGAYRYSNDDYIGHALYYKNGVATMLDTYAEVNAIAVSGSNVYCAGDSWKVADDQAVLYTNGVGSFLSDGSDYSAYYGVTVSGSDVYTAGYTYSRSSYNYTAKYWKNGTAVTLYDSSYSASAYDLALVGSNVYTVGYVSTKDATYGTYWKNQTQITVPGVEGFNAIYPLIK